MKALYKNNTTYSKENLAEAYKYHTKALRIIMILLWVFFLLWFIWILLPNESTEVSESSPDCVYIIIVFCFMIYCFGFWFGFHKVLARRDAKLYNIIYHTEKLEQEFSFFEDSFSRYNTVDKWTVNLYYSQCIKIKETTKFFIIYVWNKRTVMVIDKLWFIKWNPKTFKEFIISKIESNKKLEKQEKSKKTK